MIKVSLDLGGEILILSHNHAKFGVHRSHESRDKGVYNISSNSNSNADVSNGLSELMNFIYDSNENKKRKFPYETFKL